MNMQIEIENKWFDDRLLCARIKVIEDRGMRIFELWWTDTELLAALQYADESPRAFKMVKSLIEDVFNFEDLDKEGETYFVGPYGSLSLVED